MSLMTPKTLWNGLSAAGTGDWVLVDYQDFEFPNRTILAQLANAADTVAIQGTTYDFKLAQQAGIQAQKASVPAAQIYTVSSVTGNTNVNKVTSQDAVTAFRVVKTGSAGIATVTMVG